MGTAIRAVSTPEMPIQEIPARAERRRRLLTGWWLMRQPSHSSAVGEIWVGSDWEGTQRFPRGSLGLYCSQFYTACHAVLIGIRGCGDAAKPQAATSWTPAGLL